MAFPKSSLTNNQVHKEGNRAFVYNSNLGAWDQVRDIDRTEREPANLTLSTGTLAGGVTFPAGHVLQITGGNTGSPSGTGQPDETNVGTSPTSLGWGSASIDLIQTNAKVWISYSVMISGYDGSSDGWVACYESIAGGGLTVIRNTGTQFIYRNVTAGIWMGQPLNMSGYLHTVSNSAGDSYAITMYAEKVSGTVYANIDHGANWEYAGSHITVMEIQK